MTLDAHDYRIEALGQVVELHDVGLRLFRLLQDSASGVTLHCPARVASFSRRDEAVSVTLTTATTLEGQLLVAADGSRPRSPRSAASNGALNPMDRRRSSLMSLRLARITAGQTERFHGARPAGHAADVERALLAGMVPCAGSGR